MVAMILKELENDDQDGEPINILIGSPL